MLYYGGTVRDFVGTYVLVDPIVIIIRGGYWSAPWVTRVTVTTVKWFASRAVVEVAEVIPGDVVVVTVFRQVVVSSSSGFRRRSRRGNSTNGGSLSEMTFELIAADLGWFALELKLLNNL